MSASGVQSRLDAGDVVREQVAYNRGAVPGDAVGARRTPQERRQTRKERAKRRP